jgi:hypothetical protein
MANRYQFPNISQDINNRYSDSINALLPTYYRLSIARLPATTYFCQTASVPSVSLTDISVSTPFATMRTPSKMEFDDLTISFIVDEQLTNWLEIFNWMRTSTNVENYTEIKPLSSIDFSSVIMDPEVIQSTVTFGYRSYNIEVI